MFSILSPQADRQSPNPPDFHFQKEAFLSLGCDRVVGSLISDYFTDSPSVVAYRAELFGALLHSPKLREDLSRIGSLLSEFYENLSYIKQIEGDTESNLRSLLMAKNYIEVIHELADILASHSEVSSVQSLQRLSTALENQLQSEDFKQFEQELSRYQDTVNNIKSITVGVNLDAQLRPKEAGLISINDQCFKSGNVIDRFLRLEFSPDEYCCIAPLTAATKEMHYTERFQVDNAVNNAFEKVLRTASAYNIRHTARIIDERMQPYAGLMNELRAIYPVLQYITKMQNGNLPLTMATALPESSEDALIAEDFYDPRLCEKKVPIVKNSLTVKGKIQSVVLTGPNSGGKTVILRSLAMIQLFASLGIPVPARKAVTTLPTQVFVAFAPENAAINNGRLEQECIALGRIAEACTETAIIFLDEPFSTTSYEDAVELLHEYIRKLSLKPNTRVVITTHFHGFAENLQNSDRALCCSLGYGSDRYNLICDSVSRSSRAKNISNQYW